MEHNKSGWATQGWTDRLTVIVTSVGFLGYVPFASGTVGSLPAVGAALCLNGQPVVMLCLSIVLFILGTIMSSRAEMLFGNEDPGEIVIDEFVGMLVAFLWLPMTWTSVPIIFVLFRAFDIFKPFPARRLERLKGGFGVMADDVVAGIYANLVFRIISLIL
jgi:phosphatidylglycerophosphatase A